MYIRKGRPKAPGRGGSPGVPGTASTTIQLPPLSPSVPVRSQVFKAQDRPCGRGGLLRHTALGWRVRTPWTTPANGGSHGAAPSRNLCIRCGQRPSIHRLRRCRVPNGPRTSDTAHSQRSEHYYGTLPGHSDTAKRRASSRTGGPQAFALRGAAGDPPPVREPGLKQRSLQHQGGDRSGREDRVHTRQHKPEKQANVWVRQRRGLPHLYTYSPTIVGGSFFKHATMCQKIAPGEGVYYGGGPCTVFWPIQSGPLFVQKIMVRRDLEKIG